VVPRLQFREAKEGAMSDPVRCLVEPPGARNRWSALFRPILLRPHAILARAP
jgi:hypothetical protein